MDPARPETFEAEATIQAANIFTENYAVVLSESKSGGIGALLKASGVASIEDYGDTILSSIPAFFDSTVRTLANNRIESYLEEWSTDQCLEPRALSEFGVYSFVDLRDLLLPADRSLLLGGSGLSPYGDLIRTIVGTVQDLVFDVDETTGLSALNDVLIEPFTRSQSNSTGSMVVPGEVFGGIRRIEIGGVNATVQLQGRDARVENMNTVGSPFELLTPMSNDAHKLNNAATFGVDDRPLRFAIKILFSLVNDGRIQSPRRRNRCTLTSSDIFFSSHF